MSWFFIFIIIILQKIRGKYLDSLSNRYKKNCYKDNDHNGVVEIEEIVVYILKDIKTIVSFCCYFSFDIKNFVLLLPDRFQLKKRRKIKQCFNMSC